MLNKLKGIKRWIAGLVVVLYLSLKPAITGQMINKAGELGHGDPQGVLILFLCYGIAVFGVIALVSIILKAVYPKPVPIKVSVEE